MIVLYLRGMGSCLSSCCKEVSNRTRRAKQGAYFDSSSLIEFETLIDEPSNEPKSLNSNVPAVTQCNGSSGSDAQLYRMNFDGLTSSDDSILSSSGVHDSDDILRKLAFQEEVLELEEDANRSEQSLEDGPLPPQGQEAQVHATLSQEADWKGGDQDKWILSGQETTLGVTRLKDTGHLDNCPLLHGRPWQRERLGSSPHSSIDLEWENEVGLTPPCLESELPAAEDDFVCIPGAETCSNHSTPLSNENDLEWDGDLSSVQIGGFDVETEQLISEIEQMTAEALREPVGTVR